MLIGGRSWLRSDRPLCGTGHRVGHGRRSTARPATGSSREPAPIFSRAREVRRLRLRRATDVAMMESADLGQRNDAALLGSLNGARLGRILLEGEVGARPVVIAEVAPQTPTKVCLVQDDDVVEKLTADGADHAFGEGVLPGRAWRSEN